MLRPDHPDRIAVSAGGDAAAFVIGPTPGAGTATLKAGAASVPTLILHGQEDRCVPVGQAEELHAGLRQLKIPVEFVTYPREGHSVREPAHVADERERVLRWFETHLEASS